MSSFALFHRPFSAIDNLERAFSTRKGGRRSSGTNDSANAGRFAARSRLRSSETDRYLQASDGDRTAALRQIDRAATARTSFRSVGRGDDGARQLTRTRESATLRTSSSELIETNAESGLTREVKLDTLDFRLRSRQLSVGGAAQAIQSALAGQTETLERVFETAGLLGGLSEAPGDDFLARIRDGLESVATTAEGVEVQARSLDLRVRVETGSVRVQAEDGSFIEQTVQRVQIEARFVSLSLDGEVGEGRESVRAGLDRGRERGELRGLGEPAQFKLGNGGPFSLDDFASLADRLFGAA